MLIRLQRSIPQSKPDAERLRLARGRSLPDSSPSAITSAGERAASTGSGRFQPGALRPVAEKSAGRMPKPLRDVSRVTFDRALLLAEVVCVAVVGWLVLQYIYTAFIDTGPHRVVTQPPAPLHPAASFVSPSATPRRASPTPTGGANSAPVTPGVGSIGNGQVQGVSGVPPLPSPTPEPTVDPALLLPTRLRIPVMFLSSVVHEVRVNMGTWEVAPMDIGHHEGTANPGEVGNMVLAGHRDINSALFRDLDRLKPGDEVYVSNSLREFKYIVTDSFVVTPSHTEVMDPTDDKRVTLITCTPVGLATQRLIVTAILDETAGAR